MGVHPQQVLLPDLPEAQDQAVGGLDADLNVAVDQRDGRWVAGAEESCAAQGAKHPQEGAEGMDPETGHMNVDGWHSISGYGKL
ncbi:MAG: hypothetical protein BroJett038_33040 [Chloroflexota bacterium]|nr:MAG: hypothetical protein BroJett038_33040 [Chloroflexota bacterium]